MSRTIAPVLMSSIYKCKGKSEKMFSFHTTVKYLNECMNMLKHSVQKLSNGTTWTVKADSCVWHFLLPLEGTHLL